LIEVGFVSGGGRGEQGGEIRWGERGGSGAVEGGDRVRQDLADALGEATLAGEGCAVRGEQARAAGAFLDDVAGELAEKAFQGRKVEVAQGDEGWGR
jgi:hypothetical protein